MLVYHISSIILTVMCFLIVHCFHEPVSAAAVPVMVGNTSKVKDADMFQLYYGHSFKVIKNAVDGKIYLLLRNTSRLLLLSKTCNSRIKSFNIPLSSYSVDPLRLPVSFFELLGMVGEMKGIMSESVISECVLKWIREGVISKVNGTNGNVLDQFDANFVSDPSLSQHCKFANLLPFAEVNPLQQAEWIKYVGAFADLELRANRIYDAVKNNYLCLANAVANKGFSIKPIVAWMEYNDNAWIFAKEDYKYKLVEDAGGENVDREVTKYNFNTSNPEEVDDLHALLCTVDIVMDETFVSDTAGYSLSHFLDNLNIDDHSCFPFLANGSVWRHDKRIQTVAYADDWYDGAVSQPQLALADMIEALSPTPNCTTRYLRNLSKAEATAPVIPQNCSRDTSSPMDVTIITCG